MLMGKFRRSNPSSSEHFEGKHRFEHWYRDNTVYFITTRCHEKFAAFGSEEAKLIFWDRFIYYTRLHCFTPFVTTLLNNHYHTLGYLKFGADLGPMMRKIHGSVAKLVNDVLPTRRVPFWGDGRHDNYFDGCLRGEHQYRPAYRYVLLQAVRAGLVRDWRAYPHTRVTVELEPALKRALQLGAFVLDVPYPRYGERK